MKITTAPLSGFMELSPAEQIEFDRLKGIILETYESYGFTPIDTPTIERSEVLEAKAGGETQKQIYRFMKGDNDLSLRFDLTVPLARYVVEHRSELTFPFRRSHIGKVFRGERAQKGRYREFYQCDVDVIGLRDLSINYDSEIISLINAVFTKLNLAKFLIRVNNRKLLQGFLEAMKVMDGEEIVRIIDKAEKIGPKAVQAELELLRLNAFEVRKIVKFIGTHGRADDIKSAFAKFELMHPLIDEGLAEIAQIEENLQNLGISQDNYEFDMTIVRGLDYYTGTIYETILPDYKSLGSVCSGGRYDNLVSSFSNQKMPGVGVSIGLTRFFSQLLEIGLVKTHQKTTSQVVVLPMTDKMAPVFEIADNLRQEGVRVEVYLESASASKKMKYADQLGVKFVVMVGDDEVESGRLTLKNMETGEQESLSLAQVADIVLGD